MQMDRRVFFNDAFIPWEQATVHVASHSFARGSAIFEVLSLHETQYTVRRFSGWTSPMSFKSAKYLDMKIPMTPDFGRISCRQ